VHAHFLEQDADTPDFAAESFDTLISRHVLWIMPDISATLARWRNLLRPGGRLLLIEGIWDSGAGLRPEDIVAALPDGLVATGRRDLAADPVLWGKPVSDTRYLLVARRHEAG
jgi:SAM-dependent methyltransferase